MTPSWRSRIAVRHLLGAVVWGAFFSVFPIVEGLEFGAIVWLPVLLFCEWRRSRRFGFLPGGAVRLVVASSIVAAAVYAPFKFLDHAVGPFSSAPVPVDELGTVLAAHDVLVRVHPQNHDAQVVLPDRRVSLRQLFDSIEAQTGLRYRVGYCGNGMSVLFGAHPIFISFEAKEDSHGAA